MAQGAQAAGASKAKDSFADIAQTGEFKRSPSTLRSWIGGEEHPAEAGRYHLYVAEACPWANRTAIVRKLKGLEDVISLSIASPVWQRTKPDDPDDDHRGWIFDPAGFPTTTEDHAFGARTIRDVYEKASEGVTKFSVPILLDKKTQRIVNNESEEIVRILNGSFNEFARHPTLDLYPESLRDAIHDKNSWIYPCINNGVYRAGFARKQAPYDQAVTELFDALDRAEDILSSSRWLAGNRFTEADVRLFVTLVRFDAVYFQHFKCTKRLLREYPHLHAFTKDVYQIPGVADTINMDGIKNHYYRSHPSVNPYGIVPAVKDEDFTLAHGREALGPDAFAEV